MSPEIVEEHGGIDPDVTETAALCHDIGHPPFGHVSEQTLDKLLIKEGLADGFEGNAQSFRIINKLAIRRASHQGLNLTRATLNATLKYPWLRATEGKENQKWGAYFSEIEELEWARETNSSQPKKRCVEAEIMDWADDVAYSIHDLEDFFRAGLVPLHELAQSYKTRDRFVGSVKDRWLKKKKNYQ